MRKLLYIAFYVSAILFAPAGLQSCIYDDYDSSDETENGAVLMLRIGTVGTSRANAENGNELMHSLRFILVDESGRIEHNHHATLGNGTDSYLHRCSVTPGHKKIYIIANEESVTATSGSTSLTTLLDGLGEGTAGIENSLDRFVFTPDYSLNIPMSSMYEVDLARGNNEEQFYVVRVATKFDVRIINSRSDDVKIDRFSISSMTDESYLLPVFTPGAGIYTADGVTGVKHPFIFNPDFSFNQGDQELHWANWLKLASEESNANANDETLADKRGWIMEYDIPATAKLSESSWDVAAVGTISSNSVITLPTHYYPEGKHIKDPSTFAPGLEQEYEFKLQFSNPETQEKWISSPEFATVFPNLRALFRNTHVVLDITLTDTGVKWRIFVRPWNLRVQPTIIM